MRKRVKLFFIYWESRTAFKGAYDAFQTAVKRPSLLNANRPEWFLRSTIKPNMSANAYIVHCLGMVDLSKLESNAFAQVDFSEATEWSILNFSGQNMVNQLNESGDQYLIASSHNINCSIAIVNAVTRGARTNLTNPYYPEEQVDMRGDIFCMTGPFKDPGHYRCIHLQATF